MNGLNLPDSSLAEHPIQTALHIEAKLIRIVWRFPQINHMLFVYRNAIPIFPYGRLQWEIQGPLDE